MGIPILAYFAAGAVVLPSLIGLAVYPKLEKDLKPLLVLFVVHSLLTALQFVLSFQRVNNLWTSHIYYLIEVVILFRVYSLWVPSATARSIFLGITLLYSVFWIGAKFLFEDFTTPALYTPTVSRVLLIGTTLYVLLITASSSERPLYLEPRFWFAAGFLMLFTGSLMFYGFRTIIFRYSMDAIESLLTIHWINTIFSSCLHTVGFLCILRLPNTGGRLELAP